MPASSHLFYSFKTRASSRFNTLNNFENLFTFYKKITEQPIKSRLFCEKCTTDIRQIHAVNLDIQIDLNEIKKLSEIKIPPDQKLLLSYFESSRDYLLDENVDYKSKDEFKNCISKLNMKFTELKVLFPTGCGMRNRRTLDKRKSGLKRGS